MDRIITSTKKLWAFIAILLSTLLSYARIVRVVVRERLWRVPQRELRPSAGLQRTTP
jgi:hypothetical protein